MCEPTGDSKDAGAPCQAGEQAGLRTHPACRDQSAPSKVLVTGSSGFVGGYVVRELVAEGYLPVCLVRDPNKFVQRLSRDLSPRVVAVRGDLFDSASLMRAAEGCQAVIHLVGIIAEQRARGQTFGRIHVAGTRNVVAACVRAGIGRYAHMSALGARPDAVSHYHRTKWFAEQIVRESSLRWTIFRPSIIHGPDGEFMEMMKYFATSRMIPGMPYFGRGTHRLQPVSVHDVATCFVRCLSMPETEAKTYDVGGPDSFSWKELYDACARAITGRPRRQLAVPVSVAKLAARTVIPLVPSSLMPYKFNTAQVQMSQEDSTCDPGPVGEAFGLKLRRFREELASYVDRIR